MTTPEDLQARAGEAAALKLTWPHAEARHEHLALRLWDGHGAVRLLAADPAAGAAVESDSEGPGDAAWSRVGCCGARRCCCC